MIKLFFRNEFASACVAALVAATNVSSAWAVDESQSRSIKESTKREIFIEEITPHPRKFQWNDHEVRIGECWMERNILSGKHCFVCFRLFVDEKLTEELAIQKNTNRSIEFREEGSAGKILVVSSTVFYPMRNYLAKLRKGTGEIIHHFELPIPLPKRAALRLYTANHDTDVPEKTDVVIRFNLSSSSR